MQEEPGTVVADVERFPYQSFIPALEPPLPPAWRSYFFFFCQRVRGSGASAGLERTEARRSQASIMHFINLFGLLTFH